MTNTSLKLEINSLPKELRSQVADFVEFLKTKSVSKTKLKPREFGFAKGKIILSDEISPDCMRLWDAHTNKKLDKDRFRQDLGQVDEAYNEVYQRLLKEVGI